MKYNILSYLIGEGIRNVFKNKKSTLSALTIMCLCMLVFGIFFIIGENVNNIINNVEEAQGIQVYFKVDTTDEDIQKMGEQIKYIEGVNNIQFVSKEEGVKIIKEGLKEADENLYNISPQRIPASYIVTLKDLKSNEKVQQEITDIVGDKLDTITSSNETITTLMNIANGVQIFTFLLLMVLVVISLVIISNTIKLTVHARRKEISIMKYVGATNSFIRWPFIVEGIIIGIISAMIAILIVGLIYNILLQNVLLQNETIKNLEITFVTFSDMFNLMLSVYLGLGIGIGIVGSSISMRKYLEV
ncbi:MAG: FtsX-like permease family protein [Clostridia bacterium]|nr:FtsX-like permease family protein [Clostridia bacterium]